MTSTEPAPLDTLVDAVPMILWEADPATMVFRYVSAGAERLLGYPAEQWTTDPAFWRAHVHPADRAWAIAAAEQPPTEAAYMLEYRMIAADGRTVWLRDRVTVEFADGEPVRRMGVTVDITEQKHQREQLRAAQAVFEHAAEGICITDTNLQVVAVNPAYTRMTGYTAADIGKGRPAPFDTITSGTRFEREIRPVAHEHGLWEGEVRVERRDGEYQPYWLSLSTVPDDDDEPSQYIILITDIGELIQRQDELARLAHHDPLTGLPNRLLFRDRLTKALERAARYSHVVALAFLDLDGFKPFNDTHGHSAGDELLIQLSNRLVAAARNAETVGRIGGDEFVILFEDVGDTSAALARVADAIAPPMNINGVEYRAHMSVGVALFPQDADVGHALLRCADSAMYRAKRSPGVSIAFYTEIGSDFEAPR